jgi:ureidoacrylate peracid hydrolase
MAKRVDWTGKTALVVIDMQNDFCLPDRALCVKGAMACLPSVVEAVDSARTHNVPVVFVCREHDPSGRFRPALANAHKSTRALPAHTLACSPGADGVILHGVSRGAH